MNPPAGSRAGGNLACTSEQPVNDFAILLSMAVDNWRMKIFSARLFRFRYPGPGRFWPGGRRRARRCWLLAVAFGVAVLAAPPVQAGALPDIVSAPKAINLGSTSFYDGFGRTEEGWTWLQYGRLENLTRITDAQGNTSPLFQGTAIDVFVAQTQIAYASPWHPFGGDGTGVSALLPVADFHAGFAEDSPVKLRSNGLDIGDLNFGPFYQSKHFLHGGRPVFAWRFQFSVVAPTGGFNTRRNINQGAGFWAVNPYVAFTWVPVRRVEFSGRINYQYNLPTSRIANPPPVPGLIYRSGQAGQMIFGNFAASYKMLPNAELGVNGYALSQLRANRTNGIPVPKSRETEISVGPGARFVFNASNTLNVNLYLPVMSRNATSGTQLNAQFVHRF